MQQTGMHRERERIAQAWSGGKLAPLGGLFRAISKSISAFGKRGR